MTTITFKDQDEFERKPKAEKIIKLLTSGIEDISPLIIDGGWGIGKTVFCEKLIDLFKKQEPEYQIIYIDAFKADHANDPLMTLLAGIINLLPDDNKEPFIKKLVPALKFMGKSAGKAALSWGLQQEFSDIADGFEKDVKKAGDAMVDYATEALLKNHVEAEKSIKILQEYLEELGKDKPIILFVDELDRCRPDFAISMLENIKHIFNVQGVQFVLVMNKKQLIKSVGYCYGIGDDEALIYLNKFIGFTLSLLNTIENSSEKRRANLEYFSLLIEEINISNQISSKKII